MVERPVVSEPFEVVAIEIVGPLPQGRNKCQYLLTRICMATRWPDVVQRKSITAKSVADALIGVFSRTGLPFQIVSDNGTQFSGELMKELGIILGTILFILLHIILKAMGLWKGCIPL